MLLSFSKGNVSIIYCKETCQKLIYLSLLFLNFNNATLATKAPTNKVPAMAATGTIRFCGPSASAR